MDKRSPVDKAYPSRCIKRMFLPLSPSPSSAPSILAFTPPFCCSPDFDEGYVENTTEFLITSNLIKASERMKNVDRAVGYYGNEGCTFMMRYPLLHLS